MTMRTNDWCYIAEWGVFKTNVYGKQVVDTFDYLISENNQAFYLFVIWDFAFLIYFSYIVLNKIHAL